MRLSRSLTDVRLWLLVISRRNIRSMRHLEKRVRVPQWVSIVHPRISLVVSQSLSPANYFFILAEYFASLVKEGKIYLRSWTVSLYTLCFWWGIPRWHKLGRPYRRPRIGDGQGRLSHRWRYCTPQPWGGVDHAGVGGVLGVAVGVIGDRLGYVTE